MNTKARVK